MPNRKELLSLVDYGHYNPALPSGHPFTNVLYSNYNSYWSATTQIYGTVYPYAWYVDMWDGFVSHSGKSFSSFYVWPVRGGQSGSLCDLAISPTSQTFTSSGGTGGVTVTASSSSCTWTASESLDWVSITSGSSGTGSGTVNYSVSANTSTSSRSGNMTIAGQTFTVTQTGEAQNNCAATVSSSFVVHIPVITYSGSNYWADLAYNSGNGTLSLTNAGVVNDSSPYSNCTASTLSSDYKLHIPVLMLEGTSYWADLQYNGSVFVISGGGQNY